MNVQSYCRWTLRGGYAQSWLFSIVFHGCAIAVAVTLVTTVHLAPPTDSFRWEVALVEPPAPTPKPQPTSHQTRQAPPPPAEPKSERLAPPHVQTVQSVREVVRQQVAPVVRSVHSITPVATHTLSTISRSVQQVQKQEVVPTQHVAVDAVSTPSHTMEATAVAQEAATVQTSSPVVSASQPSELNAAPVVHGVVEAQNIIQTDNQIVDREQPEIRQIPVRSAPMTKADYSWLMKALLGRVDQLKNYPHIARINHWEGKVVLRAVIRDDGQVLMVDVHESSGRSILDNDAIETLRKASPLKLEHSLGKPQVAILMPISYSLR